jgi:hypothetical protein
MNRDHDNLPEDLTEVAERLRAARTEPTPLELDGMWQTVRRRTAGGASPSRGVRVLRGHLVAMLLTVGLVFTTGASAVIASTALSGGGSTTYSTSNWSEPKDAGYCQYRPPYTKTYTLYSHYGKTVTVSITANCSTKTICLTVTKPGYAPVSKCATVDRDAGTVTITCAGQTYTFPLPKDDD